MHLYLNLSFRAYILYTADIPLLIAKHGTTDGADDIQAFVHGSPNNQLALVSSIDTLIHDLHS